MTTAKTVGSVKFTVPGVPMGCKVPIVHLANGTTATCSAYQPILTRLATHGSWPLLRGPEYRGGGPGHPGNRLSDDDVPDLYDNKIGSTGHSQAVKAAYVVLAKAEKKYGDTFTYAGLAMEPASGFGTQPTPVLADLLRADQVADVHVQRPEYGWPRFARLGPAAYDAMSMTVEKYFWTANGATHIPVPNDLTMEVAIPWFRWKLLGDQKACAAFKALPMTHNVWVQVASKNEKPCM